MYKPVSSRSGFLGRFYYGLMLSNEMEVLYMLIWKEWRKGKIVFGVIESAKEYRVLLLLGIIPLFISING